VETIKRMFELRHTGYPGAVVRTVVHLQYLEWPDMNVPDDPRGVLGLIQEVERAVEETGGVGGSAGRVRMGMGVWMAQQG
jgi:tyrosine-protein phosphatase 2/3